MEFRNRLLKQYIAENIFRLIDMAQLVGGGLPGRPIEVADIEQIHERLYAAAA